MKVLFLTSVVVAFLLLPVSLRGQAPDRPPLRAVGPLADSLRSTGFRMVDLLRNRDARGLIGLYGDTLHFVHIDDGNVIPWSQLSTTMRGHLDSVTSNPVSVVGEPGVTLIDQNNAVLYVTHRFDSSPGREAHEGVWTGVMHRFGEGWRIVHSHSSDRPPR